MKTNKRGVLNMCEKYTYIGMTDTGEMSGVICDNCGAMLRYVVHLKDSKNKSYYVGTECSKTLSEANINNVYSMELAIKQFKKLSEARLMLEKGENILLYGVKREDKYIIIAGKKGKAIKRIVIEPIFDMFKQEQLPFINDFLKEIYEKHKETIIYGWCLYDVFNHLDNLKNGTNKKTAVETLKLTIQ